MSTRSLLSCASFSVLRRPPATGGRPTGLYLTCTSSQDRRRSREGSNVDGFLKNAKARRRQRGSRGARGGATPPVARRSVTASGRKEVDNDEGKSGVTLSNIQPPARHHTSSSLRSKTARKAFTAFSARHRALTARTRAPPWR